MHSLGGTPIRSLKILLLPFILAAGLLALTACSDDDDGGEPLSFEDYAPAIEAVYQGSSSSITDLSDEFDEQEFEDEDEFLEANRDLIRDYADVFEGVADDADGINPPADVKDSHDALSAAAGAIAGAFDEYADAIETDDEEEKDRAVADALGDFEDACSDIRDTVQTNGVEVSLDCVFGEGE